MPSLAAVGLAGLEYMERTRPRGAVCCDSRQDLSALLRRNDYGKCPTFSREASFSSSLEVQLWWRGLGGGFLRGLRDGAKSTTRPCAGQAGLENPSRARGGALRARRRGPDWKDRAALPPGIDDIDDADEIDDPRAEGRRNEVPSREAASVRPSPPGRIAAGRARGASPRKRGCLAAGRFVEWTANPRNGENRR